MLLFFMVVIFSNMLVSLLVLDVMEDLLERLGGKVEMRDGMFRVVIVLTVLMLVIVKVFSMGTVKAGEYVYEEYVGVRAGDVLEFSFSGELSSGDLDLDGLEFVGCSSGVCSVVALRDMSLVVLEVESGTIVGYDKTEIESGEGNIVGDIGEGEGGSVNWGDVELGKHVWGSGDDLIYAIRVDYNSLKGYDKIYVYDESYGIEYKDDLRVSVLVNDGVVRNLGSAEFSIVEDGAGYFVLEILPGVEVEEYDEVRYDIVYGAVQLDEEFGNRYEVYSLAEYEDKWVVGKGEGEIDGKEEDIEDGGDEVEDKDEDVEDGEDEVGDKEDEVEDKDEDVEDGEDEVEDKEDEVEGEDGEIEDKEDEVEYEDGNEYIEDKEDTGDKEVEDEEREVEDEEREVEDKEEIEDKEEDKGHGKGDEIEDKEDEVVIEGNDGKEDGSGAKDKEDTGDNGDESDLDVTEEEDIKLGGGGEDGAEDNEVDNDVRDKGELEGVGKGGVSIESQREDVSISGVNSKEQGVVEGSIAEDNGRLPNTGDSGMFWVMFGIVIIVVVLVMF